MVTAQLVKELRDATNLGILDCKKALEATNGDIDAAMEWLREKGISKAAKKESRIAAEGLTNIYANDTKAVIVEVNAETDFVAKNDDFKKLVDDIGNAILNSDVTTMEEANDLTVNGTTISDYVVAMTAKIGEKLSFRRMEVITKNADEVIGSYLHMGGRIAAVCLVKGNNAEVAKDVAMQAAAMKPEFTFEADVPADRVAKEKELLKEEAMKEGKPAEIAEKMVAGRLKKFFKEICLVDQEFIKDGDVDVKTYLKNNNCELVKMVRYEVGEGIEKKQENFAEEVMSQINAAN
ncbi:MAG: translation elongation factor Ts [bacterium]|nr:translation elongation factor Ts [bacterium]